MRLAESGDPFWNISARNLVLALIMWEVTTARAEGRMPLLKNVRGMLTGDLPATAKTMFDSGDFQMASLAGQFMEKNRTNDGIVATAASRRNGCSIKTCSMIWRRTVSTSRGSRDQGR